MRIVLLLMALWAFCQPFTQAAAGALSTEQQRDLFMQARQALENGQEQEFLSLKAKLATYPLTPYLDIQQAWKQLETIAVENSEAGTSSPDSNQTAIDEHTAAILQRHADIPESEDLRKAWVKSLAERGQWSQVITLLESHAELGKALPEIAMMSDWQNGRQDAALLAYGKHWPRLKNTSAIIAPLHQAWIAAGHPSEEERWMRIIHLAGKGQWKEISSLSSGMSKQHQQWLHYWQKLQAKPQTQFEHWPVSLSHPAGLSGDIHAELPRAILGDGMHRLIRKDPVRAHATLLQLRHMNISGIDAGAYASLNKQTALRAAKQHTPAAAKWLAELPAGHQDAETRAWLLRLHLLKADWKQVMQDIKAMPADEQQESNWQYWKARALESLAKPAQAQAIYTSLAGERGFYSFLSAERAGLPYRFDNEELQVSDSIMQDLQARPGILRAHEWLALDLSNKANREWFACLADADEPTWKAAAALATNWGWPDQAIRSAYRGGAYNALNERFPLQFEGEVLLAADETGLHPAAIWSIIRQESIFNREAVSPAGARGLMQLMPKTAKMLAGNLGMRGAHRELFSPVVNIRLGSHYLADMKSRFNDNLALAAAAYNAGPYRVGQWLKNTPFTSPEVWIEAIPYNETRRYVQHVMAFTIVYQWRGNRQAVSLSEQLHIQPAHSTQQEEEETTDVVLGKGPAEPLP